MDNIPPDEDREMQRQEMHNEAVEAQVDTLAEEMRNDIDELTSAIFDDPRAFALVYKYYSGGKSGLGVSFDMLMKKKLNEAARDALDLQGIMMNQDSYVLDQQALYDDMDGRPLEQDLLSEDPAYQEMELAETNNEGMTDKEIHAGFQDDVNTGCF